MPSSGQVSIAGHTYTLLDQKLLSGNRRAHTVDVRPSQPTDPFNLLFAEWQLHGPIGLSRESFRGGELGHDYSEDLDTRWTDLLVPTAQKNSLDISGKDPIGATTSAALGGFALGAAPLGGGTSNYDPTLIEFLNEQEGYLFASRRAFHTQVQVSGTDTLIATTTHGATIKGDTVWRGKGYLALGNAAAVKSRTGPNGTGATFTEETNVTIGTEGSGKTLYARSLRGGNDRLWGARSDQTGSKENFAFYSVTDPDNADVSVWSNSFPVGDGKHGVNGIGTIGPFTIFGMTNGIYGFTDFGKPVKLLDLSHDDSTLNGKTFVEYRGWLYFITENGLKAWNGGGVISDVGIEALKDYEGAVNGVPRAMSQIKDYLTIAYRTNDDTKSYVLLALPAPDHAATGRLEFYPHFNATGTANVLAMAGINIPTG